MSAPRQNATANTGTGAASVTPANYGASGATLARSLLIAWAAGNAPITISGGPVWTLADSCTPTPDGSNSAVYMWYAVAAGGDAVPTFTPSVSEHVVCGVMEFAVSQNTLDVHGHAFVNSVTASAIPAVTATSSATNELAVAVGGGTRGGGGSSTPPSAFTWGGGFTLVHSAVTDAAVSGSAWGTAGYADVSTAGAVSPTCSYSSFNANRTAMVAVFLTTLGAPMLRTFVGHTIGS